MGRLRLAYILPALTVALVAAALPARALETDQFTVPRRPLPDIGPELDVYVAATIWDVALNLNARADSHERQARKSPWPWKDFHLGRAARFRSEELLARRVFDALAGPGQPESRIELWVHQHHFRAEAEMYGDAEFPVTLARCVYGARISLIIAVSSIAIGLLIGALHLGASYPGLLLSSTLLESAAGAAAGAGILLAIGLAYKLVRKVEGMGLGDVKMMAMLGAVLGWEPLLPLLLIASVTGAVVGVFVAARSERGMKVAIPFGVFLGFAFLVVLFFGHTVWDWYLSLLR